MMTGFFTGIHITLSTLIALNNISEKYRKIEIIYLISEILKELFYKNIFFIYI